VILFHGDNPVESRRNLHDKVVKDFSSLHDKIITLDGKKVVLGELKQNIENSSLFGEKNIVLIENFFTRPKSKELTQIIAYLTLHQTYPILFWEGKKVSPTQSKTFPQAQVIEAKISRQAYVFVESLGKNLPASLKQWRECVGQESAGSLHYALSSHVRRLLTVSEPTAKTPPWLKVKLDSQRKAIGETALMWLHGQLIELDYKNKTGTSALDLGGELELLIINLYHKRYENI